MFGGKKYTLVWLDIYILISTIFQLYNSSQWRKLEYQENTTNLLKATDKFLSHRVNTGKIQTQNISGDRQCCTLIDILPYIVL
jgi:hypothetical protein